MWIYLLIALVALACGFAVGRVGTFTRINRVEDRLRAVANTTYVESLEGKPVDYAWLTDQIDWIVGDEFR